MLDGQPALFVSYSEGMKVRVAQPVAAQLRDYGLRPILVGEEPLPPRVESNPEEKVKYFLDHADMAVFLATPDDKLESGQVQTRANIIDEHRWAKERPHLRHKCLVLKAREVVLPSNINPAYERLPLDDPDWIVQTIVRQAEAWGVLPRERPVAAFAPQASEARALSDVEPAGSSEDAADQATEAAQAVAEALAGDDIETRTLQRAQLAIAALSAEAGSSDTLSVHLVNQLFQRRHELDLRPSERVLLLRTYISHMRDDNVPGLVWLKPRQKGAVIDVLLDLVVNDSDTRVRLGAAGLLARIGGLSDEALRAAVTPLLQSDDFQLRWAGLDVLRALASSNLMDLLDNDDLRKREGHKTAAARLEILARADPTAALRQFLEDSYARSDDTEAVLEKLARRFDSAVMRDALTHRERKVRLFALRLVERRGRIPVVEGRRLAGEDESQAVRVRALRALLRQGSPVTQELLRAAVDKREGDSEAIGLLDERWAAEIEALKQRDESELLDGLEWIGTSGPERYEALATTSRAFVREFVRADLRTDFERLKVQSRTRLLTDIVSTAEEQVGRPLTPAERAITRQTLEERSADWFEGSLGAFLLGRFRLAALRGLVAHGNARDLKFARQMLEDDSPDIRFESIRLLERFGRPGDADLAVATVDEFYGERRQCAAQVALALTPKRRRLDLLRRFRSDSSLRAWAIAALGDLPGKEGVVEAFELLWDENIDARAAALEVVLNRVPRDRCEGLLDYYYTRGQYYYNVVRRLDAVLYAPAWLRSVLD